HRRDRPALWTTVEEPVELLGAITAADPAAAVIVDCVTLWVANLIERGAARDVEDRAVAVSTAAASRAAPVLVLPNEVGAGIVPMAPESREFRDLLGAVNATLAHVAERTLLVVAGNVVQLRRAE